MHVDEGGAFGMKLRRWGISVPWQLGLLTGLLMLLAALWVGMTGGARSPFWGVFVLPILLASIRAGLIPGIVTALGAAAVGMGFLIFGPGWYNPQARFDVLGNAVLLGLVTAFVGALFRRIGLTTRTLESQASQAAAMDDLSRMMEAAYDLETTLNLVMIVLRMLFSRSQAAAILLTDPSGKLLEMRAASGFPDEQVPDITLRTDDEEHGWAPADGIPLLVCNSAQQPHGRLASVFPGCGSFLWVPLRSIEGIIGYVAVASERPNELTELDLQFAELFAERVAFPIQRASLQQNLQQMAYTDGLTRLYNHRYFQEQLRAEAEKAKRYQHPLSLIMLDIDHFKRINDTHGHQVGDRILSALAALIRGEIRQADIPARYGGEEFAILCPETPKEAALMLAERLRASVEHEEFFPREDLSIRLTISAGVAAFHEDADDGSGLIESADSALYGAKRSGRNAVR